MSFPDVAACRDIDQYAAADDSFRSEPSVLVAIVVTVPCDEFIDDLFRSIGADAFQAVSVLIRSVEDQVSIEFHQLVVLVR